MVAGHQAATHDFWNILGGFDAFISELVIEEAGRGDEIAAEARMRKLKNIESLEIDHDCNVLAKALIHDGAIPPEYGEDALHISVAAVHGIQSIVT